MTDETERLLAQLVTRFGAVEVKLASFEMALSIHTEALRGVAETLGTVVEAITEVQKEVSAEAPGGSEITEVLRQVQKGIEDGNKVTTQVVRSLESLPARIAEMTAGPL